MARGPLHTEWDSEEEVDVAGSYAALLAGCLAHGLDPKAYLRDLSCLMPAWPPEEIGMLTSAQWRQTVAEEPAREMLERYPEGLRRAMKETDDAAGGERE